MSKKTHGDLQGTLWNTVKISAQNLPQRSRNNIILNICHNCKENRYNMQVYHSKSNSVMGGGQEDLVVPSHLRKPCLPVDRGSTGIGRPPNEEL